VARALRPEGVTTVIAVPSDADGALVQRLSAEARVVPIRFARLPRPNDPRALVVWTLALPFDVVRFARLMRRERPDVVHVNGAVFLPPALAARLVGLPLVWHVNDTSVPPRAARLLGRVVRSLATVMVASAAAVARHYGLPADRVAIAYPPVDIGTFSPRPTARPDGPYRIGFLGNWSRDKGVPVFARAMAALARAADWPFAIVLAGERRERQRAVIDEAETILDGADLRGRIEDHGFATDMVSIVRSLDILVLSSVAEAAPIVVLEAMACAVPVVATDVGGVRELLGADGDDPAGLVVSSRDHDAIAAAIVRLHDEPNLAARLGNAGRSRAVAEYSSAACVTAHRAVYAAALARHRT
jgi:glycosyltransferase involved in cell wall biosynthesis